MAVTRRADALLDKDVSAALSRNAATLRRIQANMMTKADVNLILDVIHGYEKRMDVWGPALERNCAALAKNFGFLRTANGGWIRSNSSPRSGSAEGTTGKRSRPSR